MQDFSLEALRLIRAISPIGEGTADPLCTVGDGHQRIYRAKVPLSRAGIDIRGRSRRLKINYRTSEQIRQFAQGILKRLEIDDLDGGVTATVGDHSVFKGPEPQIERCQDGKAEADAIVASVQNLMDRDGLATHEICVTPYKPAICTALTAAELATFELKPREEDPGSDEAGVRLGTMKRIKGLEFRAVALACADPSDPMNSIQEAEIRDRCERYVAATRGSGAPARGGLGQAIGLNAIRSLGAFGRHQRAQRAKKTALLPGNLAAAPDPVMDGPARCGGPSPEWSFQPLLLFAWDCLGWAARLNTPPRS